LLDNTTAYTQWRANKLASYPTDVKDLVVPINDPFQLTPSEKAKMLALCRKTNMVVYQITSDRPVDKVALQALSAQFGLFRLDHNLGADDDGVTALQVLSEENRSSQEYIPYTNRPINWHTDGYYNTSDRQVRGLLLHCVRPALMGGENLLLDHEMAYLHLRDIQPDYIAVLMEEDVMTIPPNLEGDIELRPAQSGPVFSIDPLTGSLQMRYTARTKSIIWKPHPVVKAALNCLTDFFNSYSPYIFQHRLTPNQGLICTNVLHTRSGFTDSSTPGQQRLLYRMRFYDRMVLVDSE
jgi:hypothetical protein